MKEIVKKSILLIALLVSTIACKAPQEDNTKHDDEIYAEVDEPAEFTGGLTQFGAFIDENMEYPPDAKSHEIEGKVFVQFIVDKEGNVTQVAAVKGIGGGCDEEAVRIIKKSPKWKPAKKDGQIVKSVVVHPVTFKL